MRKFIFRIFPKFSPFPKTFLGNSPIFPIPLRKKFFGEMEALHGKNHGRRLFTPIPQNVFEQKEWNLQLKEARILSSCLLLPLLYSVYSEARLGWRKSHFLLSFFSCLLTLSSTVFCPFFTDERKCTITLILHFLDTQY